MQRKISNLKRKKHGIENRRLRLIGNTYDVRDTRQRYRDDTLILETEFVCDGGVACIIDFTPVGSRYDVVRIVEGVEGDPDRLGPWRRRRFSSCFEALAFAP